MGFVGIEDGAIWELRITCIILERLPFLPYDYLIAVGRLPDL